MGCSEPPCLEGCVRRPTEQEPNKDEASVQVLESDWGIHHSSVGPIRYAYDGDIICELAFLQTPPSVHEGSQSLTEVSKRVLMTISQGIHGAFRHGRWIFVAQSFKWRCGNLYERFHQGRP